LFNNTVYFSFILENPWSQMPDSEEPNFPAPVGSAAALAEREREQGSGKIVGAAGMRAQKIVFNSAELDGGDALRKDEWIASLSSGYARLHADPAADMPFNGELQIALLDDISVGTIRGTVKTISRTAPDIAAENTDNVVLLWNAGTSPTRIEQGGRSAELAAGSSVLIEQCEPPGSRWRRQRAICWRCRRRGGASARVSRVLKTAL
jgi:hypothetical protein